MARPKAPVAAWITQQRKANGWKVEELAQRLDVSAATVRGWEAPHGRPPSADNLEALEREFGVQSPMTGSGPDAHTSPELVASVLKAHEDLMVQVKDLVTELRTLTQLRKEEREGLAAKVVRNEDRLDQLDALVRRLLASGVLGDEASESPAKHPPLPVKAGSRA